MKKLSFLFIFCLLVTGCKKYPDDENAMHLLSVKTRLCRAWCNSPEDVHCNGGALHIEWNGHFYGIWPFDAIREQNNTWLLIDNNNKIRFVDCINNVNYEYLIIRLEQNDGDWHFRLKNDSLIYYFIGSKGS